MRTIDVGRAPGIGRNILSNLYDYDARERRVELADLARLCPYFRCLVRDLREWVRESTVSRRESKRGPGAARRRKGTSGTARSTSEGD
jgi:hypothetical protein